MGEPSARVLRAFAVRGPARAVAGGQGTSWRAGDLVLKPEAGPVREWLGAALAGVAEDGFRLAAPVRAATGTWCHDGWSATRWVAGDVPDYSDVRTWIGIVAAGRAFHRAVAGLERPGVLDVRQDRWARADRVVWGEDAVRLRPEFAPVADRLRAVLEPLGESQVVHGDLTGNVLFAPGAAPAVIDVSPYWRPPAFAEGVVVADALCWHDAPPRLWETLDVPVAAVARALLFRMVTTNEFTGAGADVIGDEAWRHRRAAAAIGCG